MATFTSKEQVLRLMNQGDIRMSSQDNNFFQTIYGLIYRNKKITSNQDSLFNKLLVKYKAQLKRKGYISSSLCELPWATTSVIPTVEEFSKPNLGIDESGYLKLRVPFKTKFISTFNAKIHNPFVWDSGTRAFKAPLSTRALMLAVKHVEKYFDEFLISPEIKELLNQVPKQDAKFWSPTLTKINNRYYIAASNQVLDDVTSNIVFSDDPICFFQLSKHGIAIDPSLFVDNAFAKFAANYCYEITNEEIDTVCSWIKQLGDIQVVFNKEPKGNRETVKDVLKKALNRHHIKYKSIRNVDTANTQDKILIDFWGFNKVNLPYYVKKIVVKVK